MGRAKKQLIHQFHNFFFHISKCLASKKEKTLQLKKKKKKKKKEKKKKKKKKKAIFMNIYTNIYTNIICDNNDSK